jgi:hypothetical protein
MRVHAWLKIALFHLIVVALLGTTLRYKIAYSLPFIDQKHLLHAHSHFAFAGWVSLAIMALMIRTLSEQQTCDFFPRYHTILWTQVVAAWGMLISFTLQGYGAVSIGFSTLSIVNTIVFAYYIWKDTSLQAHAISTYWFRAAVVWNILSHLGTGALVFMMITKTVGQESYLAALYLFLHFQYNGWFLFGIIGLFTKSITTKTEVYPQIKNSWKLLVWCLAPAYFLSILWLPMHPILYTVVVITAIVQVAAVFQICRAVMAAPALFFSRYAKLFGSLVALASLALGIKLILQVGSTIPALGKLAFGYRSIIIGYLHLILLGVISLYLVAHIFGQYGGLSMQKAKFGIWVFVGGLILNELLLMLQGGAGMGYVNIPYINDMLLGAAFIMLSGLTMSILHFGKSETNTATHFN